MVEIRLTNSKTRRKDVFRPLDPANVRMYLCGPTVYDRAHLGNARPVVVFDVLYRLLRHVYGEDSVTYVRNFTDVDDKINARAAETGRPIRDITDETIRWYHEDMDALGALRPDHEPRATDYIPQMVAMIEALIAKGHAYIEEVGSSHNNPPERIVRLDDGSVPRHVYFSVRSAENYGRLSGRNVDDLRAGARVEIGESKRDPLDFVLWKPSGPHEPGWVGPRGENGHRLWGRPGWHIECSAMSAALLGESFDIHGGGVDLMFPHHENEIAQSRSAHPNSGFANVWMHNEMLQVEGRKMSKSLGNFFTVRDLLDQGIRGEVLRYVMLMTHYRKPMDWTAEKAGEAKAALQRWRGLISGVEPSSSPSPAIVAAIADDLNTAGAIKILHDLAKADDLAVLAASAQSVGLLLDRKILDYSSGAVHERSAVVSAYSSISATPTAISLSPFVEKFRKLRESAKTKKDFSALDAMKAALISAGIEVRMSRDGVALVPGPDFDPAKLSAIE